MNKKTRMIWILSITVITILVFLSSLFHQEAPKNTIRILVDRPMDERHLKLAPLLRDLHYTFMRTPENHSEDFDLIPPDTSRPILHFRVVRDENTRALFFLKGEADVLFNTLSLAKTEWVKNKRVPESAKIYSHTGDSTSFLALNDENPVLHDPEVRRAITLALPLKLWKETVFFNWVDLLQPESEDQRLEELRKIRIPSGIHLRYLTTSVREGQQMAFLVREALGKIGITVEIHVYESALFFTKIRKREFDLFSSRSIPGTKTVLDLPHTELIPLFLWRHGLILHSRIQTPPHLEGSLDYSFRFLSDLQLPSTP